MEFELTVGGTPKLIKAGTLSMRETANRRCTVSFRLDSLDRSYRPAEGADVLIRVDGRLAFGGLVDKPYETGFGGPRNPGISTRVTAVDYQVYAERRFVNETFAEGTSLKVILQTLVDNYLAVYGVSLAQDFSGSQSRFLIEQAEYYRWLPEGDARLKTFFYGPTLAAYDTAFATIEADLWTVIDDMPTDERGALVAGAISQMWAGRQGYTGSEARWFMQQAEFYRFVEEGDGRLQTYFMGDTLSDYDTLYASIFTGLAGVISGMAVDELAAFDAAYVIAQEAGFSGTEEQFLLEQAEFYRWMPENDARILTFFYAGTLTAFEAVITGAFEDGLADIIAAMNTQERAALAAGYANAQLTPTSTFRGSLVQFFVQQAEYYRWLPEGDGRLKTFFYASTLTDYEAIMGPFEDVIADDVITPMAGDEAAAFAAAYADILTDGQVNGPNMPALVYDYKRLDAVMNELMTLTAATTGGQPFVWEIGYDKIMRAYQPSTEPAPFDLVGDDLSQVVGDVEVETARTDQYANRIILKVKPKTEIEREETFVYGTDPYPYVPQYTVLKHWGYITHETIFETLRTPDDPDAASWTFDPATQELERDAGTPTTGDTTIFKFDGSFAGTWIAEDAGEIAAVGIWEKVLVLDSIPNDATGQQFADAELAKRSAPIIKVSYKTWEEGLTIGQQQTITIPARDVDGDAVIVDISTRDLVHRLEHTVTAVIDATQTNLGRSMQDDYDTWFRTDTGGGGTTISAGTVGSAGPAPPNKSVQFNKLGAFGGDGEFTYDHETNCIVAGEDSSITATNPRHGYIFGKNCHAVDP